MLKASRRPFARPEIAEIRLAHRRIAANLLRRAVRDQTPVNQHGDAVCGGEYGVKVVLDDDHCVVEGEVAQQCHYTRGFLRPHAAQRLVEDEDFRAAGDEHCDF